MNIAAEIKNTNKKSNYVVSLSFDIPIKSARSVLDKPISGQFTITPSQPKKNFKLKIAQAKSIQQYQLYKEPPKPDSYRPVTSRNEKKSLNKSSCKNQNNTTRHSKNLSFSHSKSPSCVVSKPIKQNYSLNETLNMKAIKKNMIYSTDEDITGYTDVSSELKKQEQKVIKSTNMSLKNTIKFNNQFIKTTNLSIKNNDSSDSLLISEIRRIQSSALQKKQRMSNEYRKRRILQQASARRIQRAWRNYKTKKLIHVYSQTLSMKSKKKQKDGSNEYLFNQKRVLNVKSCELKNGKNEMKRQIKQAKLSFFQQDGEEKDQKYGSIPQLEIKKQLQIQQIKKWEELIKELRKNKNVNEVLEKAEERKKELIVGQEGKKICKTQNEIKKDEKLINTINRIQNEEIKYQIQKTIGQLKKINIHTSVNCTDPSKAQSFKQNFLFEDVNNQMQQANLSQKQGKTDQISPIYLSKLDQTQQDQILEKQLTKKRIKVENEQMKKRKQSQEILQNKDIENFKKFKSTYMEKQYQLSETSAKPLVQQAKQDIIMIEKQQIQAPMYNFNRIQELLQFLCYNAHEQFSTKQQQVQNLLDVLLTQIICQLVLQLNKCKNYSEIFKKYRNQALIKFTNQSKQSKPEGICTNMESIKDYLQNMVAFVLDECPIALLSGLNTPGGYDSLQIFRAIRKQNKQGNDSMDSQDLQEEFNCVLPKNIFKRHWQYASQQIYFEKKFDDRQKQIQRTRKLKQITKVYFQAIFDCFNQCLNHFRACGVKGAAYPWQRKQGKKPYYVQTIDEIKPMIKMAFKKLSEIATIFCGLLIEDKKTNLSLQMEQDIREERMNIFLEHEIHSYNYKWRQYRKQEVEVLYLTSNSIQERLILQVCFQFILC